MKKLEVYCMDYGEFDDLVEEHLLDNKRKYEFVAYEELGNDIDKLYSNIKKDPDKWDLKKIEEFLSGKMHYRARGALVELCRRGIIPEGNYLIRVSW